MLNATTIKRQSIQAIVNYYKDGADDYYAKEDGAHGWQGTGSKTLSLDGSIVEKDRFRTLLDGQVGEGVRLKRSLSDSSKERLAIDLTFSAPKSVSLQALVHGDARIVEAHNQAVDAAIAEAEKFAAARVTEKGVVSVQMTGNLVVAKFRHETSREQEPQLHTHAVVMNMTRRKDGKWRALMNDYLFKNVEHLSHVYNAHLSRALEKMGFSVRYEKNGSFDLAHISQKQIEGFSSRRAQIDQSLKQSGLQRETASAAQRNAAALRTRQHKRPTDREDLHRKWTDRSRELGIDFTNVGWAGSVKSLSSKARPKIYEKDPAQHAADALSFAVRAETERQAVVTEKDLVRRAMIHGMGKTTHADIERQLRTAVALGSILRVGRVFASTNLKTQDGQPVSMTRAQWVEEVMSALSKTRVEAEQLVAKGIRGGRLVDQGALYTTEEAMNYEKGILQREKTGRDATNLVVPDAILREAIEKKGLSVEQRAAVTLATQTKSRFVGIQGFAGVGKSYQIKAAKAALEKSGIRVEALAPYSTQKMALEAEGVHARTVEAFLHAKDKKIDGNTVVFIDEAGVIPARQMNRLMTAIETHGARAVLLGDVAQTKAIEAGKPFEQLIKNGMKTAAVTEIQRQKRNPDLLRAVQYAAEGKIEQSIESLERTIQAIPDRKARLAAVAAEFAKLSPEEQRQTLVITGTNESRRDLNRLIRDAVGTAGRGIKVNMLERVDTTRAERDYSKYYRRGDIVISERNFRSDGLEKGKRYRVVDTGPGNHLTLESPDFAGHLVVEPTGKNFSVYTLQCDEIALGDRVRLTRNENNQNLANGEIFNVEDLREGRLSLVAKDGKRLELDTKNELFIDIAYATTVHSAQGHTSDRAILDLDTRSRTTSKEVFYVGASRAKTALSIFTDNKDRLPAAAKRATEKRAALDYPLEAVSRRALKLRDRADRSGDNAVTLSSEREQSERRKGPRWLQNLRDLTRVKSADRVAKEKNDVEKQKNFAKER